MDNERRVERVKKANWSRRAEATIVIVEKTEITQQVCESRAGVFDR